ncbi:MAG: hypothetical protein ACR2RV_04620 [Verrucomicrobiales bacterium]
MRHLPTSIAISLIHLATTLAAGDTLPIPNWKMVQSMDSDRSGTVSRKEFLSSREVFDFIDQDRDGALTRKEVLGARKSTPAPPETGDPAPPISALDPSSGKSVKLHERDRPFALIFGTHT